MLDQDMKQQLTQVFSKLDQDIELAIEAGSHNDQSALVEMLNGVAECSPRISVTQSQSANPNHPPRFEIKRAGQSVGIKFCGIPGGHEFTSLIVAILNTAGQGKMPDSHVRQRIQNLKGPIRLKTYISLSCENCPDVVQTLNQMALIHSNFEHEMIDGAYAEQDIKTLGIQGVPSVVNQNTLVHSGKITLIDLLSKLEKTFGIQNQNLKQNINLGFVDVLVLGGGPAGASAAIYSARKGLKTALVAEKIGGQVQDTKGIENLISVVYTEGPLLAGQLAQHLAAYPIQIFEHRRVKKISKDAGTRTVEFESGELMTAKSIIVTTGAKWRELGIPGEKEYIGRGVAFCPHCDGPYYKGKKVAVIGGGNSGVEAAIDLAGIVREVVLLEFAPDLKADKVLVTKLKSLPNVSILTNVKTETILGNSEKVHSLQYQDRATQKNLTLDLDGVFVQIGLVPNSQFLKGVVELTNFGEIIVDNKGRTSEKGIYAAGDVTTTPYKQIIIAMGEGAKVALAAFEDTMLK